MELLYAAIGFGILFALVFLGTQILAVATVLKVDVVSALQHIIPPRIELKDMTDKLATMTGLLDKATQELSTLKEQKKSQ